MPFDVELSFTGLGVLLIRSDREHSPTPSGAEILLLRTTAHSGHSKRTTTHSERTTDHSKKAMAHAPRLCFRFDELASPENTRFRNARVDNNGTPIAELNIADKKIEFNVEASPANFQAQWTSNLAPPKHKQEVSPDALDWIPDIEKHFGAKGIILPNDTRAKKVYAAHMALPPGSLTSRLLLLNRNGTIARWTFGKQRESQILAEHVVWTRRDVSSFRIKVGNRELSFDAQMHEHRGEPKLVRLSITNLPRSGESGRFNDPTHFGHLNAIRLPGTPKLLKIKRVDRPPGPITSSGACPPVIKEIIDVTE